MTGSAKPSEDARDAWLDGNVRLVTTSRFDDARGSLVPYEWRQLPFVPHRLFTIQDVPAGTTRGCHASASQRQMLICVTGRIEVEVRLDHQIETVTLDRPHIGLLVEPGVWNALTFLTPGTVLLALASGPYDPNGYIAASGTCGA